MEIIKQLRRKSGINQSDLASAIGVSLRTVQLYEKKDANIPIKNLNKIADFFKMSVGELYLNEVNEVAAPYSTQRPIINGRSIGYRLEDGKMLLKVPLVTTTSYGEFLDRRKDEDYLNKLVRVDFLVSGLDKGCYMAFEITGNAMDDGTSYSIPNGALVLGKKMEASRLESNKKFMKKAFVFIFTNRIICKSITDISMDKKTIVCHNFNLSPEFQDFEISLADVKEIYEVVKKQV